jgi:hypothetical protein
LTTCPVENLVIEIFLLGSQGRIEYILPLLRESSFNIGLDASEKERLQNRVHGGDKSPLSTLYHICLTVVV